MIFFIIVMIKFRLREQEE